MIRVLRLEGVPHLSVRLGGLKVWGFEVKGFQGKGSPLPL